jgi:hypothetical protein
MTDMLSDVIRELEADLRQPAVPADVTDEQRAWALISIAGRAAGGDAEALAVVERLKALARSDPAFAKIAELVTGHERAEVDEAAPDRLRTAHPQDFRREDWRR